jgi:hypothetical protein
MKAFRLALISSVLILCLLICVGSSNVEASEYLGDLCWESTCDGSSICNTKLGVLYIGGSHFLLSGKITKDGNLHSIVQGNAEIEGSKVYMILVHSGKDSESMWSGIIHIILDISNLNGTAEVITHVRDGPIEMGNIYIDSHTRYSTFSVSFIPCP